MSSPVLAKKVYLEEAIAELSMKEMPVIRALITMLMYSKHDKLNIYFDEPITSTEVNNEHEMIFDSDGELTGILVGGSCEYLRAEKKEVVTANAYQNNDTYRISLNQFKLNGIDYYPVDDKELWLTPVSFNPNSFYFDRDELLSFISKMDFAKESIKETIKENLTGMPEKLPVYLDPESIFYAEEMDLAVQLHKAIYIDNYAGHLKDRVNRVRKWLDENKPSLVEIPDVKLKRLSTIIAIKNKKK
jgi:hypothetical protein